MGKGEKKDPTARYERELRHFRRKKEGGREEEVPFQQWGGSLRELETLTGGVNQEENALPETQRRRERPPERDEKGRAIWNTHSTAERAQQHNRKENSRGKK